MARKPNKAEGADVLTGPVASLDPMDAAAGSRSYLDGTALGGVPDVAQELARLRDLSEPGANLQVYRWISQGGNAGRWGYLERLAASDFDIEDIRTRRGGGRFRMRLVTSTGQYVPGGTVELVIEGEPRAAGVTAGVPLASDAPTVEGQLVGRVLQLLDGMEQRLASIERGRSGGGGEGAGQILTSVASALAALLPVLRPASDSSSAKDLVEMFLLGRDEGARGGPRESSPDWSPLLQTANLILSRAQQTGEVVPGQPKLPASVPAAPGMVAPSSQVTGGQVSKPAWYSSLAPYLGLLVQAAANKFSPASAANAVGDFLERLEQGHPVWVLLARQPVEIDGELAAAVPAWSNLSMVERREWLTGFCDELRNSFSDEAAD